MKTYKTIEVIDSLIGAIHPVGETNEDDVRYENLQELIEVVSEYISRIENVAEQKDSTAYSLSRAGKRAYEFRNSLTAFDL